MFAIASFFRFVELDDLGELRDRLVACGHRHRATGTIAIAPEGINATIAAAPDDLDAMLGDLRSDDRFADITPTHATSEAPPFLRLRVRIRREIITMGKIGDFLSPGNVVNRSRNLQVVIRSQTTWQSPKQLQLIRL